MHLYTHILNTHTIYRVPSPLGKTLEKLPSLVTSHYSPLVRCFSRLRPRVSARAWGHPLVANKWGNGVSGGKMRKEGCLHLLTRTSTPRGIDCNRCFTFASLTSPTMCLFTPMATCEHPGLMYAARHTHVANGGIKEACVAPPATPI